ncbi:Smr/MutS family protein [Oceaniovalibus sp. ACAM 378]|uniref:Smr/MutS family protein n=1 Tax=Oceaniovalibus sp. ACAM 378 TaxID=2599923 RepID=UPI00210221AB|nr:Smr/MutS family protein [Oceaniovalibus sp. ACAM 378]
MVRGKLPPRLSAEDRALWRRVADQAVPMHPARSKPSYPPEPAPPPPDPEPPRAPIPTFTMGQRVRDTRPAFDLVPPVQQRLAQDRLNMDHKAFTRMRRGKLPVEGRVDLHGMTLAQANPTLTSFILGSQSMGRRLVLVITGKGSGKRHDPFGSGPGVLKRQVPQWLRMAPLSQAVLQVSEAHQSHGGSGAYYVYLRRNR